MVGAAQGLHVCQSGHDHICKNWEPKSKWMHPQLSSFRGLLVTLLSYAAAADNMVLHFVRAFLP